MRPRTLTRQPISGCDVWRSENGHQWIRWDQWFCAVAAADHGGDLGALDAAVEASRSGWGERDREAILVQLDDLRQRLGESGISCAELVGDPLMDPRVLLKARAKVLTLSLQERDRTQLMLRTPHVVLKERARAFGVRG